MTRPPNFFRDARQPVPALLRKAKTTGRDADPRRTLKLNGYAWQKLRRSVLAGEPLCRHCAARGLTVEATDVDHMNGADDNRLDSLQPLCHECHSRVTAGQQGKNVRQGCDKDGWPLDPCHVWNDAIRAAVARAGAMPEPEITSNPAP